MITTVDRATLAAELHAYAEAVAAGTEPVPAMRRTPDGEATLKVVPRVVHNVLCSARAATPQDTDPVVLACVRCGLCYPIATDTATTTDTHADRPCSECGRPSRVRNRWIRVELCAREECLESAFDRFAAKTGVKGEAEMEDAQP